MGEKFAKSEYDRVIVGGTPLTHGLNIGGNFSKEDAELAVRDLNITAESYADKHAQEKVVEALNRAKQIAERMKTCFNEGEDAKTATQETALAIAAEIGLLIEAVASKKPMLLSDKEINEHIEDMPV